MLQVYKTTDQLVTSQTTMDRVTTLSFCGVKMFDKERMEKALAGRSYPVPTGLSHEQRLDFAKGIILLESLYPKLESQEYHNPHDMMEMLEEIESYGVEVPDIFHDWIQDLANM
jgi:hypothetical protein